MHHTCKKRFTINILLNYRFHEKKTKTKGKESRSLHTKEGRKILKCTLPIKAAEPPSLEIPTATLAGAPPGAFLKAGASASETPATVGTKSISISPKQTTIDLLSFISGSAEGVSEFLAKSNILISSRTAII